MADKVPHVIAAVLLATVLGGCARRFVPAPSGTALDAVCNPMNGALTVPLDTVAVGPAAVALTKGWTANQVTAQEATYRRIDAELNIWRGSRFVFPAVQPRNAVRCSLARGDTTITIQAVRLNGFDYRVDVAWDPLINGQYFYMQLQTRYVEHLRTMRGMIEAVRFPVDTNTARR